MKIRLSLLALLCIPFCMTYAQSDEINISAAFSSSIDLRIAEGANINMAFTSLNDYEKGKGGNSTFQVASSVNFNVDISMTPFTNADGDEIDLKNLTFRIWVPGDRQSEEGVRWVFSSANTTGNDKVYHNHNDTWNSAVHVATTTPRTVLEAGPSGNAGTYEDNEFGIRFYLGEKWHANLGGVNMPLLLDQNIAPGTYTCTVTLEAIPEAL